MYIGQKGDYVVEAKQGPSHLEAEEGQVTEDVKKYLYRGAVKDAVSAEVGRKAKKLGIAFLVPWSSKPPDSKAIRDWIRNIPIDTKMAVIWTFPGVARTIKYRENDGKFYSPSPECPARKSGDEWRGESPDRSARAYGRRAEALAKEG